MQVLLSPQLFIAALILGALYALVALGLNLIYGTMRLLNVGHGEIVMVGAYAAFWSFVLLGLGPLPALILAPILTGLLGLALYRGLFRRLLAHAAVAHRIEANSLLLFFGVSVVLQNLTALIFTANFRGYRPFPGVVDLGFASVTGGRLLALTIALAVAAMAALVLRFTPVGLAIRALIQNRSAAALAGVDTERLEMWSFVAGFAVAGLAGALVSMIEQISPFMGFPFTIAAFVIIILGGLGNLTGSLLGGFVLGVLETYGVALTSPNYRSMLVYGVFILVLLIRPQGLLGRASVVR
ncbi:MAG TPA: branched-chain amino acid ABC transporter permease [Alphaproteobacteria bacterium]|nr:branched-chain amino acid ABC transporter permease [Alphaproteobacteria bacterium]